MKNILITGASGLIGTRLTALLKKRSYNVSHLGRKPRESSVQTFLWDIDKRTMDSRALENQDVIVHLAGAGIADKRWTAARKNEIIASRTESTRLLYEELKKGNHHITTFVSASAIGFYGTDNPAPLVTENEKAGNDFQADVVRKWEDAVDQISTLGIRVVRIRTGIVLSEKGGALKELIRPIKLFVGAPLGSGEQYLSWIHLDDLCAIFIKAIEEESIHGPYNAVAPNPVTNKTFTTLLAEILHKPILLPPIPSFILKVLLGEMAVIVIKGSKISSAKIQSAGFQFQFATLKSALQDLIKER